MFSKDNPASTAKETRELKASAQQKNVRIWGTFNYTFKFHTQGESLYQTSMLAHRLLKWFIGILYAKAEGTSGFPIPIVCKWYRVKNERTYEIPKINTNVYQLSAEDIACKIRVEATPIDEDTGFTGKAIGEFGPIELDPSAR